MAIWPDMNYPPWLYRHSLTARLCLNHKKFLFLVCLAIGTCLTVLDLVVLPAFSREDFMARIVNCDVINPYEHAFLIQPSRRCGSRRSPNGQKVILCLISSVNDTDGRDAVRKAINQWKIPVDVIFFLGVTDETMQQDESGSIQRSLFLEANSSQDVVQSSFQDSPQTRNLKTISILKWISEFCQRDYDFVVMTTTERTLKHDFETRFNILIGELTDAALDGQHYVVGPRFHEPEPPETVSSYCSFYPRLTGIDWSLSSDTGNDVRGFPIITSGILFQASQITLWTSRPNCDVISLTASLVGIPMERMWSFWPYLAAGG